MSQIKTTLKHSAGLAFVAISVFSLLFSSCKKKDSAIEMETYSVNKVLKMTAADIPDSVQTNCHISLSLVFPANFVGDTVAAKIAKDLIYEAYEDSAYVGLSPLDATDSVLNSEFNDYKSEVRFARQKQVEFIKNGEDVPRFLFHNAEVILNSKVVVNDGNVLSVRIDKQ